MLLAGPPPKAKFYASIERILLYGVFGISYVLAVGPVGVVSLVTTAGAGSVVQQGARKLCFDGDDVCRVVGTEIGSYGDV